MSNNKVGSDKLITVAATYKNLEIKKKVILKKNKGKAGV